MTDHDPTAYGARIAEEYDDIYGDVLPTDAAVARLAALAGDGRVLELGIGTGRLALPLSRRGVPVHGVDSSPEMVARLAAKPGGADIPVTIADFGEVAVAGPFSLVVLAFNTVFALPDQDAQVQCFRTAAAHLSAGGHFVVEAWVPDVTQFHRGDSVRPRAVGAGRVALVVAHHDPVAQRMTTTDVHLTDAGIRLYPANHRYAWPSELDLMARLAGLRLEHRWEDWEGSPFTATSTAHVSVYRRDG